MQQVMAVFEKPPPWKTTLSQEKSVFSMGIVKDSPQSSCQSSQTTICANVAASIEHLPCKYIWKQAAELGVLHSNKFDHMKKELVVRAFQLAFINRHT
jgi:hypothetical protein